MRRMGIATLVILLLGPLTIHYAASGTGNTPRLDPVGQALLGYCSVVSTAGKYAYAGFGSAIVVLDMQDPHNPSEKGRTFVPNCFDGKIGLWNDRLFVPRDVYGLGVFDVADPAHPSYAATYFVPDQAGNEYAGGVELVDGYAFWANGPKGLTILDVHDPSSPPTWVGGFDDPHLDFAMGVHVVGNLAYLCTRTSGVFVIDVSDKAHPRRIASIPSGWAVDMAVSGPYGFLADGTKGLKVIDLATHTVIASFKPRMGCYYRSIVIFDNFLYAASATSGVDVLDVSSPLQPRLIQNLPSSSYSNQLALADNHLYVADCLGGLKIFSLANPSAPQYVTTFGQPDLARDVAVLTENMGGLEVPRFAYLAYGKKGLAIVDVNDPARPSPAIIWDINTETGKGSTQAVTIKDGMLFAADGLAGLKVFSLSDPRNPELIWPQSSLPGDFQPVNVLDVQVVDHVAYLADSDHERGGVWIVDMYGVENPGFQPSFIKYKHGIGYARRVFKHGEYVYVASNRLNQGCSGPDPTNGLYVFKLDQSMEPAYEVITLKEGYEQISDVDTADVNNKPYVFVTTDGGPVKLPGLPAPASYLHILEHSIPDARLFEVSKIPFSSPYFGNFLSAVEVVGHNAYVDHMNTGIYVYDVNDPSHPQQKSFFKLTCNNNSYEIHLFAGLIYDAHGDSGLYIFRLIDDSL